MIKRYYENVKKSHGYNDPGNKGYVQKSLRE
jgi:hypothetical protein